MLSFSIYVQTSCNLLFVLATYRASGQGISTVLVAMFNDVLDT